MRTASSPLSQSRPRQLVQGVAAREHEWLSLVRYDLDQRWYQRLAWDDGHELWLLSWLPGQRTGFHDHGDSSGAFTVAFGALRERIAPRQRPGPSVPVARGEVRSFGPWYVHDVINASVQPARLPPASYHLRIIVMCVEGYTSSLAAASLQDLGVAGATDLAGGFRAWQRAGLPVVAVPAGPVPAGPGSVAPGSVAPGSVIPARAT